jgi:hypothetical protein
MAVLVTAIHAFLAERKTWMAGTRPAMTGEKWSKAVNKKDDAP